ncbi:diguanylate cyclase [Paraburkholderia sediminicola]|uniref:diguanylate cyclase n=1 Tax=Paraburkholderia sediminicola TaxID=458836 RepID=UPI0038BC853B
MARLTRFPGTPPVALRLSPLFWLISCVILLSSALLAAAPSLRSSWDQVANSRQTVARVALLDAGIKAAWQVSTERGPTNGLLGADTGETPVWRERLDAQRIASDRALAHLRDLLAQDDAEQRAQAPILAQVVMDLRTQRLEIDRVAALPLVSRDPLTMEQRVDGMIALVAPLAGINVRTGADIVRHDQLAADNVEVALLAAELREYVGQAGSRVAVGLFRRRGLSAQQRRAIGLLEGRIDELQFLINMRLDHHSDDADFMALRSLPITQDLADGETLVEQTLAAIQTPQADGSGPELTPGQFSDRYVPKMGSLEALPDRVLDEANLRAEHALRAAHLWLWISGIAITALLGVVTTMGVLLNRCVIRPLLAVTAHIRAIVEECEPAADAARERRGEIADLLHASAVLRRANRRRQRLERERDALLQRLGRLAETDHLTGLLNRRVFDSDCARALSEDRKIAVLLCDIDFFKQINDRFGHATGDQVLLRMAQRLESGLRASDALYRYGGEEFAVIVEMSGQGPTLPLSLAERLRETLEAAPLAVGLETLRVTLSIGVSWSVPGDNLRALVERADKALYRAKHDGRNCVRANSAGRDASFNPP